MNQDIFRNSPLFAGLSDNDLARLLEMCETIRLHPGEILIEQGAPGDSAYIILDGEMDVQISSGEQTNVIATRSAGDVIGEIALLDHSPRTATVLATRDSELLRIPQEPFETLLTSSPTAALSMLRSTVGRLRNSESVLLHQNKMAALGTLSAGLAHELNNPAAAAQRSATYLGERLLEWQRLSQQVFQSAARANMNTWLDTVNQEIIQRAAAPAALDPLRRIDLIDEVQGWLESSLVDNAWDLAPSLVNSGWDRGSLDDLRQGLPSAGFDCDIKDILLWVGASSDLYSLLNEIQEGTRRISQIVKAMKAYTYLDQAPIQEVDVHEGLENTLVILDHKLKQGVSVKRQYEADLPHIEAYASELNQVWTNLIDNAIEAMHGNGELTLRTGRQEGCIIVEVCDNGSGIPEDIQTRIFDAFYTTKQPGEGTGLGLHIVNNIVCRRHGGQITVNSNPGETCFKVRLPILLEGQSKPSNPD